MCSMFGVSRGDYYDWSGNKPGKKELSNRKLDIKIKSIYLQHHKRYGYPRITNILKAQNETCSHTRVARRMKYMNIKAIAKTNTEKL